MYQLYKHSKGISTGLKKAPHESGTISRGLGRGHPIYAVLETAYQVTLVVKVRVMDSLRVMILDAETRWLPFAITDSLQSDDHCISTSKQTQTTVLICIHDILTASNFTPPSVVPTVNTCVTAFSVAEFSDLLQIPNIEGHAALYRAIANGRRY
ncbi:hypothetical protein EDB19DRAFT_1972344 [Suillus lakei]|nr:hypothetical protein EDB19DRAFT_1972344 [Suillus lakei]